MKKIPCFNQLLPTFLIAIFLAGTGIPAVFAQEVLDNESCSLCHEDDSPKVNFKEFQGTVHGDMSCVDCHWDIEDLPHAEQLEKVDCTLCHDKVAEDFHEGVHFKLSEEQVQNLPRCTDCHGVHNIYSKHDLRALSNKLQSDRTCLNCHASSDITEKHPNMAPAAFLKDYESSVHARAIHKKGLIVSASCTDCHGAHKILPESDPASPVNHQNIPETCKKCHLGIFAAFETSTHGKLWKENNPQGPVCTTCHDSHGIGDPEGTAFRMKSSGQCGTCHAEQSETYSDSFHGKATSFGFMRAATCSDCHTAHNNLPASDPLSTVNPANLVKTCGQCHQSPNRNFVQFDPHLKFHPEKGKPLTPPQVVYSFMEWLLIGVFSFWGLHTFLWLQRALVAVLRKEIKKDSESGKYVRRFSTTTVRLHIIIVVSFLGLVATGLPLKYHYTEWAQLLVHVHGGIEITRFIHRCLAIVTLGYCLFHLANISYQILFRGQRKLLFGPWSLVPRSKDFSDLFANLKWFLYLGKQPAYGRWTYFEKFDYFAVFWGVPVIGLSGLMMWFPGFTTTFLPGWVLNAATTIHSEEALLAAAFIFTVHFFHNHLRPENFPMDISIFTGKIPLERMKHERPEEYEILVRENRLKDYLVEPPTKQERARSFIFGTLAVIIGLGLVAGILFSFL